MNKHDKAMSDIDEHASPAGPSSPASPDNAHKFIKHAIYGSETPKSMAQDTVNSHVGTHAGFMDSSAQHQKKSTAELHRIRNTALEHGKPWAIDGKENELPHYQHGDPEY